MKTALSINPGGCPVCTTPVEGQLTGIWTGFDKARNCGCGGPRYTAVCKKCGAELESAPTHEQAEAGLLYWEIREPRVHVKQHREEKDEQEAILKPLLQAHAEREQVTRSLGFKFTDHSVGSSDPSELRKWLFFDEVNEAAARYPGILFHMNATTMTWLFFDGGHRLQGYFIRSA
jgi:hypothetical protein